MVFFWRRNVPGEPIDPDGGNGRSSLAMMKMDVGEENFLIMEKGVIIPRKGLGEIRRLVEDVPGDVLIGIRQGMCIVKTDHVLLKVSLVDGEYPDYKRVIPSEKGIVVGVEKESCCTHCVG